MIKQHFVSGYDNFVKFMNELGDSNDKPVNILFYGQKDEKGISWCPDCIEAERYIDQALNKFGDESVIIYVDVGDRATWKNTKNPFRTDKNMHLSVIPTIIRWKNPQRVEGYQCRRDDLLERFFTDV